MGPVEENHDEGKCRENMAVHIVINCNPIDWLRTKETQNFISRKKLNGTSETDRPLLQK